MKLTGKCKEDFKKWLFNRNLLSNICIKYEILFFNFYDLTESMQYGVYVDFFDSVDILIEIMPSESKSFYWIINDNQMNSGETDTRPQARLESIKEVNKIYNEK